MNQTRYKCPFCGNMDFDDAQTFKSHAYWKHDKSLQGDLMRFRAPSYGLGSDSDRYEREAYEERRRQNYDDGFGSSMISSALGFAAAVSVMDNYSSPSVDSWSGGGGDSGGGGADGSW